jgi:uncharacterized membrane protein
VRVTFFVGLLALLCFDTTGQVGFKLMADAAGPATANAAWVHAVITTPAFMLTVSSYIAAFFVYMWLLRCVAIGPLFAASHLELVTVAAISIAYFGERFSVLQALGCTLIVLGIIVLGFSEGRRMRV